MSAEPSDSSHKRDGPGDRSGTGEAVSLGLNLAGGVALFTFIGQYIDRKHGGGLFWTLCGLAMGLLYGAYEVWKVVRVLNVPPRGREGGGKASGRDAGGDG